MAKSLSILLLCCFAALSGMGQPPGSDTLGYAALDRALWRELVAPLDYGQGRRSDADPFDEDRRRSPAAEENAGRGRGGGWLDLDWLSHPAVRVLSRIVLILGGAALLFFLIRALFEQAESQGRKKKLTAKETPNPDIAIEQIEAQPHEFDLDTLIGRAEQAGNLVRALRLRYLQALYELAALGLLERQRGKSNRAYVAELTDTPVHAPWRVLTTLFERTIYGGFPLSPEAYAKARQRFDSLTESIEPWAKTPKTRP